MSIQSLVLASASPRRKALLEQIGITALIHAVNIDETPYQGEQARDLVQRLAKQKAEQGVIETASQYPVLGSDTIGLLDEEILLKPQNVDDAQRMLTSMSGRWHEIHTAVALKHEEQCFVTTSVSRVKFRQISKQEIKDYWQTGEPQDKAGAYAVQGLAAVFIERIEGSYSGIMGLPLFETSQLLQQAGLFRLTQHP